jgi:CCR4-NOT transcription complex subunit 3
MAARKTQQEIDKTFKKVAEGIQAFEGIYEKIRQATNPTQRDKLEDHLKREIKKLQRFRDQIKSWAAGNEVKDKAPLIEQRKAIEVVGLRLRHWAFWSMSRAKDSKLTASAVHGTIQGC